MDVYCQQKRDGADRPLRTESVPVSAWKLGGEIVFVTSPGEVFCEFALDFKRDAVAKYVLFLELANGYVGYIPTVEAFKEGGYEVRKTDATSYLDPEAGKMITETMRRLARH